MLSLADIRDWLIKLDSLTVEDLNKMSVKDLSKLEVRQVNGSGYMIAENFYIGKLDSKKEKSIGVYQLKQDSLPKIALGGNDYTKILEKSVSILVHWSNNAKETEEKAMNLYNKFLNLEDFYIGETKVDYIKLLVPEPIDVGTDDSKIYERVIEATFYYERKEN